MGNLKKSLLIAYIVVFFSICIIPIVVFPFLQNSEMIEKKELSAAPSLIKDGMINTDFSSECNSYISDHFPFRTVLLFVSNHMLSDVFKSPVGNVVTGRDGWLFYEDTVADYTGTNAMSEDELNSIIITLDLMNEQVEANGGHFVFAPVPNKNSIYSQFMPDFYIHDRNNNLDRLYTKLATSDIHYVNLKNKILQAVSFNDTSYNDPLVTYYHKKDSHWNNLGAEIGYNSIMESIDNDFTPVDYSYTTSYSWDGDLEKLLYPKWWSKDLQYNMEYQLAPYEFVTPTPYDSTEAMLADLMSDKEENDSTIVTKHTDTDTMSELYMIRDSFGRAILPYMINQYDLATFVRTNCPYIATLHEGCDVVYEIVERNLGNITATAPYMYAPQRDDVVIPKAQYTSDNNCIFASDEGYAFRLYGTIDRNILGKDSRIYVLLTNDNYSYTFEAFPIHEQSLPDSYADGTAGYSLMLDSNSIISGDYEVSIISGEYMTDCLADITINGAQAPIDEEVIEEVEEVDIPIFNEHDYSDASGYDLILEQSAIIYNNTAIHINDNINDLLSSLGNMSAPSITVESCIAGTNANEYYYPSLTLSTLEDGTIFSIDVKDNGYHGDTPVTTIGITLGSLAKEIDTLIGSDYLVITDNPRCYTYSNDTIGIYYYCNINGIVSSISITDTGHQVASEEKSVSYTPLNNGKYVVENYTNNPTGWRITDGAYEYYDKYTGERVTGAIINGIPIAPDGSISHDADTIARIDVMMKARWVVDNNTLPTDTKEEKRLKVFKWILSFPYKQHRKLKAIYDTTGNLDVLFANDIFVYGSGDCVSESAALAFLFKEVGYNEVYFCHDTAHSWVMLDGHIYDPLFAEARDFEKNYDAVPYDYRKNPPHQILVP